MRTLRAEEINVKPKQVFSGKILLLLYKDARVDMDILDEVYGTTGWKRSHKEVKGNLFCTIEVWDKEKGWVAKEDVGIESNMEGEKGEASDAFKRAGFNWGIGRELYTGPQIWVTTKRGEVNDKGKIYTKFSVSKIEYEGHSITALEIVDDSGEIRFQWEKGLKPPRPRNQEDDLKSLRENATRLLNEAKVEDSWRKKVLSQFDGYDIPTLEKLIRAIPNKEKEFQKAELDREAGRAF